MLCFHVILGGKTNTYEGGIRLPTVIRYPGVIKPGSVIDEPTHMVDLLPTVAGIVGVSTPTYKILDGKDILPLLKGEDKITPHEIMFHYCGSYLHSARYRPRTGKQTGVHLNMDVFCQCLCMFAYMKADRGWDQIKATPLFLGVLAMHSLWVY